MKNVWIFQSVFSHIFSLTDRAIFNRWTQICPALYFRNPICLQIRNKSCKIYKTEFRENIKRCNFTYSAQCTLYSVRAGLVHSVNCYTFTHIVQCTLLYVYSHCTVYTVIRLLPLYSVHCYTFTHIAGIADIAYLCIQCRN